MSGTAHCDARPPFLGKIDLGTLKRHKEARRGWYPKANAKHPARMVVELARWGILQYSTAGDWVLDPMAGIGTTGVEALKLGRRCAMLELEPSWAALARDAAMHTFLHCRNEEHEEDWVWARQGNAKELHWLLPGAITPRLTYFSIPFGPTGHHPGKTSKMQAHLIKSLHLTGAHNEYGTTEGQIGQNNRRYGHVERALNGDDEHNRKGRPSFLWEMLLILTSVAACAEGTVLVHLKNFVLKHELVRLDNDTILLAEDCDLKYRGYWLRPIRPGFFQMMHKKKNPAYPLVQYETVLVFDA